VALYKQPVARACVLGVLAGVIYFAGTLYWVTGVMATYGGLSTLAAVLINLLLIAYQASYLTAFAMAMSRLTRHGGPWTVMVAPLVWVTMELGRTHLLTGFPWVLLGYSQVSVLPIAQLASVVGVFGLSGLVVTASASLAVVVLSGEPTRRASYLPLAATSFGVAAILLWGSLRIGRGELTLQGDGVRVGLIQGNVAQADKGDGRRSADVLRHYLEMTRQAIVQGAQVVLWPESSTTFYFGEDRTATDQIRALAQQTRVPILLGSDQIERGEPAKYYNAAFLVKADGSDGGVYRKMHLVPFGEYVPLKHLFFFMARLVEAVSDFSPGESAVLLPVNGHQLSTSICYEVVYPDLVRTFVREGSELISTITNDAWFGPTSAPYQHFAQASMRAIENGRYLVRAANTGISGIVDPYGRVLAASRLFEPAVVVGGARFLHRATIYTRTGDLFAYACSVATLALLLSPRRSYTMHR
jgi:apolipoprotein N-acyltransferase